MPNIENCGKLELLDMIVARTGVIDLCLSFDHYVLQTAKLYLQYFTPYEWAAMVERMENSLLQEAVRLLTREPSPQQLAAMDIEALATWVAKRTGATELAKVAQSSVPQLRYDQSIFDLLRLPAVRAMLTQREQAAIVRRIQDEQRQLAAWRNWGTVYGRRPTVEELAEWHSDCGCEAVDGCWVEPDGHCEHGCPAWLLALGYGPMITPT